MENLQKERLICKSCGEQEEESQFGNYFMQIEEISKNMRQAFKLFPIPKKYTHFVYGCYGSVFDLYIYFFTPKQIKDIPAILCDECFRKLFAGQKLLSFAYMEPRQGFQWYTVEKCQHCGQIKDTEYRKQSKEIFEVKKITKKMRKRYRIPAEYQSYTEAFELLNHKIDKSGIITGKIFLLQKSVEKPQLLCSDCLGKELNGQIIKAIDFRELAIVEFTAKI